MATTKLYLDDRVLRQDGRASLKVVLRNRGTVAHMPLGIAIPPACWKDDKVVLSKVKSIDELLPAKPIVLNNEIKGKLAKINLAVSEICGVKSNISATALRGKVQNVLEGKVMDMAEGTKTLIECYDEYIASREKASTRATIQIARNHVVRAYKRAMSIRMDDIDEDWVEGYVDILRNGNAKAAPVAPNTAWNYYQLLKTMWRYSQKKKYVPKTDNPFECISLSKTATRSRALEVEDVRKIWFYEAKASEDKEWTGRVKEKARDLFKLIICLCGINMADLYELKESDIRGGRLEADRKKTGVHINIKLEPEALELINKYKKDGYLIGKLRSASANATSRKMNFVLGKYMPGLTIYWARHTWASLAVELDIPDRTVFMGLAHKQGSYSDETYITMRNRKLDEANRRILDYIICGKT